MLNCLYTTTAREAITELNHMLRVAQSTLYPNVDRVRQIEASLQEFATLAPEATIWKFEGDVFANLMD